MLLDKFTPCIFAIFLFVLNLSSHLLSLYKMSSDSITTKLHVTRQQCWLLQQCPRLSESNISLSIAFPVVNCKGLEQQKKSSSWTTLIPLINIDIIIIIIDSQIFTGCKPSIPRTSFLPDEAISDGFCSSNRERLNGFLTKYFRVGYL